MKHYIGDWFVDQTLFLLDKQSLNKTDVRYSLNKYEIVQRYNESSPYLYSTVQKSLEVTKFIHIIYKFE